MGSPSQGRSLGAAAPAAPAGQYESYSGRPYLDEYEEHPDIVMTSAGEGDFLAAFRAGAWWYHGTMMIPW